MTSQGYYRYPAIHDDVVVFVSEDDLWAVPVSGGPARRLTSGVGAASHPCFSPDGSLVAFSGSEEGIREVYVMEARGGPARRLTFLGDEAWVVAFSPDGSEVVFATSSDQPFAKVFWLQAVPAAGGPARLLPYGPARNVAFGPGARAVLARFQDDPARWKRYRGGLAGDLWIDPEGAGEFRRLVRLDGNLARPMWVGERIWFLSDHEGVGNLYSCRPDGSDLARHTDRADTYVRHPSSDGRRIAYHAAADLWLLDPASGENRPIEVELASPRTQTNRKFARPARYLEDYALHPKGHSLALTVRGRVYAMGNWEGPVLAVGASDGVRQRLARWLPDGERIACVGDAGGEEAVEVRSLDESKPPRRFDSLDVGRAIQAVVSPAGERIALTNHRHELGVLDLAAGTIRWFDRSPAERITDLAWSSDGRWIAYSFPETDRAASIRLLAVETGEIQTVTDGRYRDVCPSFDPEGRYLYFLSHREFDPVYDSLYFDLNFPRGMRPYLVTLSRDLRSPFSPEPRPLAKEKKKNGAGSNEKGEGEAGGEAGGKSEPKAVSIDLAGIGDRIVRFPVPEGRYGRVQGIRGKVLLTRYPIEGALGRSWAPEGEPPARGQLLAWDFEKESLVTLVRGVTDFSVDLEGKTLVYQAGWRLRVLRAGEKPATDPADGGDESGADPHRPSRQNGWIDLARPAVPVVPPLEWAQMFREAWRLMRDHFWTPDMSGVDWNAVYERYRVLVERVGCRSEFSDLMWEMQGELGTSHAYELGGDYRSSPRYPIGQLAADFEFDNPTGGYRVRKIVRGEAGDPERDSPLAAPGVNVGPGDVLVAIGGMPLSRQVSPQEALVNQAGREVRLAFLASGGARRTVVVKTLSDARGARYREWVRANRERVRERTEGRAGYLHIPNMGPAGYAEFHRDYLAEVERPALVVDVRYNTGGHVSQLLLEKLARRRLGYDVPRWGKPSPYPSASVLGPMVALANEFAGSDGDIFSHCFKLLGLGPVVGKRTWGGVVGIWPRHRLVDGSFTTQPEFSMWFREVGWGLENHGAEPDVEVEVTPQDHARGIDPQLDRAIEIVLSLLEATGARTPEFGDRPRLGPPPLPPRA